MTPKQITKDQLINSLWARFQDYAIALTNGSGDLVRQILQISTNFNSQIEHLNSQYGLFGKDYWGYGINSIDDSVNGYYNPDITEIQKSGELNKHHKFGVFNLLIFRIEKSEFIYSVLQINLCSAEKHQQINLKKNLEKLTNVTITQFNSFSTIKLHFDDNTHFSFQVEFRYRAWDYTPDYKAALDKIIEENKNRIAKQQKEVEGKMNTLIEKLNVLADGQQLIYDDIMEVLEGLKPNDKGLLDKVKNKVKDILVKKGLDIIVADAMKEVDKLF